MPAGGFAIYARPLSFPLRDAGKHGMLTRLLLLVALELPFSMNDYAPELDHGTAYDRVGRGRAVSVPCPVDAAATVALWVVLAGAGGRS